MVPDRDSDLYEEGVAVSVIVTGPTFKRPATAQEAWGQLPDWVARVEQFAQRMDDQALLSATREGDMDLVEEILQAYHHSPDGRMSWLGLLQAGFGADLTNVHDRRALERARLVHQPFQEVHDFLEELGFMNVVIERG